MTLHEIHENAMNAPTMMEVEEELEFIRQLMAVPVQAIEAGRADFAAVMDRLYESHMQAVYEVDDQTLPSFVAFAEWLDGLASTAVSLPERKGLESLAEHFRIDPKEIKI